MTRVCAECPFLVRFSKHHPNLGAENHENHPTCDVYITGTFIAKSDTRIDHIIQVSKYRFTKLGWDFHPPQNKAAGIYTFEIYTHIF